MPSKKSKQKLKNISERGYSTVSAPRKRQEEVEDIAAQDRLVRALLSARTGGVRLRVAPAAAPESEVWPAQPGPSTERLEGDDLFKLDEEAGRGSPIAAPASYAAATSPLLSAGPPDTLPSPAGAHSPRSGALAVPVRQRSDRAWNPEDAARSIPLERFPAFPGYHPFPAFQAPQDELLAPSATLSSAGGTSSAAAAEEEGAVVAAAADGEAAAEEAVAAVAAVAGKGRALRHLAKAQLPWRAKLLRRASCTLASRRHRPLHLRPIPRPRTPLSIVDRLALRSMFEGVVRFPSRSPLMDA